MIKRFGVIFLLFVLLYFGTIYAVTDSAVLSEIYKWENYFGLVLFIIFILLFTLTSFAAFAYIKKRRSDDLEKLVKKRTLELLEANTSLEELNKQMNLFLGIAAHDLRNPISSIYGISDVLIEDYKNEIPKEIIDFIQRIKSSSEFMLGLVNQFLDVSAIQSGNLVLNKVEIDYLNFIDEVIVYNSFIAKRKHIIIDREFDFSEPLFILIDKNKCIQLLNNLISNALKFSPENTKITVKVELVGNDVITSVIDQGLGIDSNEISSLFNVFVQGKTRATAKEKGVGLGLSICKKIVEAHAGKIYVESKVAIGSIFYFSLPINKVQVQNSNQDHLELKEV